MGWRCVRKNVFGGNHAWERKDVWCPNLHPEIAPPFTVASLQNWLPVPPLSHAGGQNFLLHPAIENYHQTVAMEINSIGYAYRGS